MNSTLYANRLKIDTVSPLKGGYIRSNETKMFTNKDMAKRRNSTALLFQGIVLY